MLASFVLMVCAWASDTDPAVLVSRLSSASAAERETAAGDLEELGRPALPALYRARETADGDLARRIAFVADLIERQRLLRATKVRLDFDDRPLVEVVASLRDQTGFPLVLDADKALEGRRVSLRAAKPLGFWEALDRLAAAGGVRHDPAESFDPARRALRVPLVADAGPPFPASHAGPFRVNLARISRHRAVSPGRPPSPAETRESVSAVLQVFAEPGLAINGNGPPVLHEATDDRGRDLRPDLPPPYPRPPLWPPRFDEGRIGTLEVEAPLRPEGGAGRIRRLEGSIPITVVARTDGPLVLPVTETPGPWRAADGMELRLAGVQREEKQTVILLAVRGEPPGPQPTPGFVPAPAGEFRPPFRLEDHLRVVDDRGRDCSYYSSQQRREPGVGLESRLVVSRDGAGLPARVLYHGVVGAAAELVFEFVDQPLP